MTASDAAELSSLATVLEDTTTRITTMAERYQDTTREDVTSRLFEVERSLRRAIRSIEQLGRDLG